MKMIPFKEQVYRKVYNLVSQKSSEKIWNPIYDHVYWEVSNKIIHCTLNSQIPIFDQIMKETIFNK